MAARRISGWLLLVLAAPASAAVAQAPADYRPVRVTLEDVPYPYSVSYLPLVMYGHHVRLAYMDVAPAGTPDGKSVVLPHGMNFFGEYWAGTIEALRKEPFRGWRMSRLLVALGLLTAGPAWAQTVGYVQAETDEYTRYEIQSPAERSFRIRYDVSATTAGARHYFNGIREGATATVHGVTDLMTGKPLEWRVVSGDEARAMGMSNAAADHRYIAVVLARAVPNGGQARIRIDKTYRDTMSVRPDGDRLIFERPLGINRNAVVLPPGYEVVGVNLPSQVATESDGRIKVSFMNPGPAPVPYRVEARRLAHPMPAGPTTAKPVTPLVATTRLEGAFSERAFEDRDITYFLLDPTSHSFRLFHDYTETHPGIDRYLNVVRPGSKATDPGAYVLDTGERLTVETVAGAEIARRGLKPSEPITPEMEVVLIRFPPVPEGGSARLRIEETYTDPGRYYLAGDELVWDRTFGRPRNTVILPAGWYLTASAMPGVVTTTEDGRLRLRFINDRPGEIAVSIRARRR